MSHDSKKTFELLLGQKDGLNTCNKRADSDDKDYDRLWLSLPKIGAYGHSFPLILLTRFG